MIFALPLSRSGKVFFSFLCGRTRNKAPREQTIAFLLPEWSEDFWFVLYVDTERSASCEELSGQQVEEVACVTSGLVTFSGARDSCFSLQKRPLYEGCSLTWAVSSHPCPRFPPAHLVALSEHSSGGLTLTPQLLSPWLTSAFQIPWQRLHSHAVGSDSMWTCREHGRVPARIHTSHHQRGHGQAKLGRWYLLSQTDFPPHEMWGVQ